MKGLPLAFLGLACVGCATTTYRTAQGTELHEDADVANQLLRTGEGLNESTRTLLSGDPGPSKKHHDEFGADDPALRIVCQLEIIGKVELLRPSPATAQPSPAEPKASPPKP